VGKVEWLFSGKAKIHNMGSALDTGQVEQVIEENIFPASADNNS